MKIDWTEISKYLIRAERARAQCCPRWRRYGAPDAPPPLSEAEVCEAEEQLGIVFPDEYRHHLLAHSAGGQPNRLHRSATGWGWEGDTSTDLHLLATAFPHPDSYVERVDELDDSEPREEDFPDRARHQVAWRAWDDAYGVLQEHKTSGAVYIQEHGCGFATLLVVTGPYRGTMWFDGRATCDLILPLTLEGRPLTFAEWVGRHSMDLVRW
ncbi:SMI1/KNR4 family protein [Streptomyces sp. NPDC048350]|uniref:SMI1/KNR4 family protein n=1 Tax=Streptomyces sp. NPDC048350 TaxID=3365538 RepID=UPI0037154A2B